MNLFFRGRPPYSKGFICVYNEYLLHLLVALYIYKMSVSSQTPVALSPPHVIELNEETCSGPIEIKKELDRDWLIQNSVVGLGLLIKNLNDEVQRIKEKHEKLQDLCGIGLTESGQNECKK